MTLLELRDVRAGYGSGPDILTGVTLDVDEGATTCVIGPNGAGKSTMLKAIVGLVRIRSGEVHFDGARLDGLRPDQILDRGVCLVPTDRSLFGEMTVRENLAMAGYSINDQGLLGTRVDEVLEMFPVLAERRSERARALSGGQQQIVALARAWILRPRVLLVDEPSMGLAPQVAKQVFDMIDDFREAGMTVLLVEQNARKGLECAQWGCVLDLGAKRFDGPADSILANPEIHELYLGRQANGNGTGSG
ncbi:MAG TPA: ABC transporter ATP-binding protein [Solirubrobacterales bacterium]|jgi:branched-chain amino acid transport system ATP-binding protein|nr:ABC transporter ATP-binding protein [Solirubrobacterales bacterium]